VATGTHEEIGMARQPIGQSASPWQVVWITGASTGIGRALALRLAKSGAKVAISARSADKLAEVASLDANIVAFPLDVTDAGAVARVHAAIVAQLGPIDLAVLNAGSWEPMSAGGFQSAVLESTYTTNVFGVTRALEHLLPAMRARGQGHIALVASVAGWRGLPKSIAYGSSKAALIHIAECLKVDLAGTGIDVSIINPGFVDTPLTARNTFAMPFMITADDAAARMHRGLERKKFEIAFPWQMKAILKTMRILPYWLYFMLIRQGGGGSRPGGTGASG
jgi:short-subunit dehydrogenase